MGDFNPKFIRASVKNHFLKHDAFPVFIPVGLGAYLDLLQFLRDDRQFYNSARVWFGTGGAAEERDGISARGYLGGPTVIAPSAKLAYNEVGEPNVVPV